MTMPAVVAAVQTHEPEASNLAPAVGNDPLSPSFAGSAPGNVSTNGCRNRSSAKAAWKSPEEEDGRWNRDVPDGP
jgi:hypothetical protein